MPGLPGRREPILARAWRLALSLTGAAALSGVVAAQSSEGRFVRPPPAAHVRFSDDRIAEVVRFGAEHSAAFRRLQFAIEQSDSTVYVQEGRCPQRLRSCTRLMPAAGVR